MGYLFAVALVTLVLSPTALPVGLPQADPPDKPCRARSIYVAGMGDSAEAERFRRELEGQLKRRRFTPAARAEEADASLTGKFSFNGGDRNGQLAFDAAELRDGGGARLWHGNFYFTHRGRLSLRGGGNIKDAAGKVAANLRTACR